MAKKIILRLVLALTLLTMLACTVFVGGPEYPAESVPVSAEARASLEQAMAEALKQSTATGNFRVTITEVQLTSLLAKRLAAQSEPLFTDPQVFLRDGQVQIYGRVVRGPFIANVRIALEVGVDESGKPTIRMVSADFGPLPIPAGLQEFFAGLIEEAFTGPVGPIATGIRLTEIRVENGLMTLSGRVR